MAKIKFKSVSPQIDFPAMERELLEKWYQDGIVQKYLTKNNQSTKYFSFQDGPITANNPMGVHHAWGRTYKDLWQRFYAMRGYRERFQNGFDCQGLWVEVEVEKELGFKTKKDIEVYGVAEFVEKCKERVYKYAEIQTEQTKRLGNFMDWDHSYFTMSDENNYMIWHFLKVCHNKGWIYKGMDSVPWCPRCETAISQHEMLTEDYKELTHETVFFKLPVKDKDFKMVAWTTTPWTIPANVALAVNPNFQYSIWENTESHEKVVILNESSLPKKEDQAEYEEDKKFLNSILEEGKWTKGKDLKGTDLVGLKYEAPFDYLTIVEKARQENPKTFHTVVAAPDLVVATKGTGILHVAPGAGKEDFDLSKENKLSIISPIADNADYVKEMGEFAGLNAKKHPEVIIDFLKAKEDNKYLLKTLRYTHRYPACWRCKTELVWKVADEWYISMDNVDPEDSKGRTLRQKMVDVANKINWLPSFGLERELDWLKNMHDWLISKKNRYWGLALPIYECPQCGNFEVIDSKEELKNRAVAGWEKFDGHTPHKPFIDEVKIKCSKCGEVVERIKDVGNPWLDAGIVPFSTIAEDNQGEPLYKKDKKEWEHWFPADFITESFPGQFKNWFYALIAMSTVLEDANPYKTVLGFGTLLAEDGRPMHKSWGNSIEFNEGADKIGADVMRWMYVRQNPADNMLFGYNIANDTRRRFHLKLWNIYNFFVTYANLDDWSQKSDIKSKPTILDVWILNRLNETIDLVTAKLTGFDAYAASAEIEKFVDDLSLWYVRRSRDRVGPAANEKEKGAFYETCYQVLVLLSKILAPFTPFMSDEMFKNLTGEDSVHLTEWPESEIKIDHKLIKDMQLVRDLVEKAHAERKRLQIPVRQPLSALRSTVKVPENLKVLVEEELNVKNVVYEKLKEKEVELDTAITPELEEEAKGRELIRQIQQKRKDLGLNLNQKIKVTTPWIPRNKDVLKKVQEKTVSTEILQGEFSIVVLK